MLQSFNVFLSSNLQSIGSLFIPKAQGPDTYRSKWWVVVIILVAGGILRFWGLGEVGLHREDEDTTALPALHILEDGTPRFPSGMFYARAIVQSYMIAASVYLFGDSEWALRLPSAIAGVLLILLSYLLGRRFLHPPWDLAFTATVAFLPGLILASQTARMYIFLLVCLAAFSILVFRWERTERITSLVAAVLVLIIGLQFHTIAILGGFLLFFPAFVRGKSRLFWHALVAFAVLAVSYQLITEWIASFYFPTERAGATMGGYPSAAHLVPEFPLAYTAVVLLIAVAIGWLFIRGAVRNWQFWGPAILIAGAFVAQASLHYHLAAILFVCGFVVVYRQRPSKLSLFLLVLLGSLALAIAHIYLLYSAGVPTLRNIIGVMVGWPSIYAYFAAAEYSLVASLLCALGVLLAVLSFARGRQIPEIGLFFLLSAWIPLLLIGAMSWNPPPRYTIVTLLPLLLTAWAVIQSTVEYLGMRLPSRTMVKLSGAVSVVLMVALVGPRSLANVVHAGYDIHPDHKGAAEYVRSLPLRDEDVLLAEDIIVQRYYLDDIDFWLINEQEAAYFSRRDRGVLRDIYTDTPIMGSFDQLVGLINDPSRGDIYILGSGENQENGREGMRGREVHRLMMSNLFPTVYHGRDGLTKVWKIQRGLLLSPDQQRLYRTQAITPNAG